MIIFLKPNACIGKKRVYFVYVKETNYTELAFVGIFLIISEWPPLSHRLLWFMVNRVLSEGSVNSSQEAQPPIKPVMTEQLTRAVFSFNFL